MKDKKSFTVNIDKAIEEGAQHLTKNFDSEQDDRPWFEVRLEKDKPGYLFHFESLDDPHAPGRALDAMLSAETMTDFTAGEEVIEKYKKAVRRSVNAPDRLPGIFNSEGKRQVFFHNFREALLAYNALYRYRNDREAYNLANEMLEILLYLENGTGYWDSERMRDYRGKTGNPDFIENNDPTNSAGRLIYPLIKWHETTGNREALDLAHRFAAYALNECFDSEGRFSKRVGFHVHSITSAFSGICDCKLYDKNLCEFETARLEKIFKTSILPLSSVTGWVKELKDRPGMGGEVNSTGDIIQTMLILYRLTENYDYLSAAEKAIRGHLLPSQVFPEDIPENFRIQMANPDEMHKNIAERMTGGFGFPFPEERAPLHYDNPYCRITTLDITGGAVQALCRIKLFSVEKCRGKYTVNLLLPQKLPGITLEQTALNKFILTTALPAEMRIPDCASFSDNGEIHGFRKSFLFSPGRHEIVFAFNKKTVKENLFGNEYVTEFIGEQAVKIIPEGKISNMLSAFSDSGIEKAVNG